MPFLFEQQHHKWESFFSARPFDRVPDLSGLKECIPCVGYDYYTKTTPLVIKHAERRLDTMRTARAQERIRDRASEHSAHEAAAALQGFSHRFSRLESAAAAAAAVVAAAVVAAAVT